MHSASEKPAAVRAARNDVRQMMAASRGQKHFETEHSGVFATPGLLLAHYSTGESEFNCEFQIQD
jgi:hypothetical protein